MASSSAASSSSGIHIHPHSVHADRSGAGAGAAAEDHDYESLPTGAGWGVNMMAGAMAGISEHAAIFPVDSIKTRMQILPNMKPSAILSTLAGTPSLATATSSVATSQSFAPQSLTSYVRHVSTTDGLRSLWRGVASVIMGAGPAHAAHFGMYEFVREISGGRGDGWTGFGGTALAGAAATISSDALMNPFDVIKQRMQIQGSPYRSVLACARSVFRAEGFQAFYISYPTTLTMNVPFTAVQFSVYESLKDLINPEGGYSPMTHVTAGGIAGGVAAAVTTPLDVAKTLLQTRGTSTNPQIRAARGMAEALRIIYACDGVRGLRRGMLPRVLTVAPSTAISWLSYEFFKVFLREHVPLEVSGGGASEQ